jgi:hypothetical protein
MPSLKLITVPSSQMPLIYLIDESVGRGGVNRRPDVMLVQLMIRILQDQPQKLDGEQYNFIPRDGRQLNIDGVCGEETVRSIVHFKSEHDGNATGDAAMIKDARIDPMRTSDPFDARSKHVLSILRLNQDVFSSIGADRFRKLHAERLFPPALRNFFFV